MYWSTKLHQKVTMALITHLYMGLTGSREIKAEPEALHVWETNVQALCSQAPDMYPSDTQMEWF